MRSVFAFASLVGTLAVAAFIGVLLSRFFIAEAMKRDALLTVQFIQTIADVEVRHGQYDEETVTIGQLLDSRLDDALLAMSKTPPSDVRGEFYDHLRHLPDALLVHVYARDMTILWSTNPYLIGTVTPENEELREVIVSGLPAAHSRTKGTDEPYRAERLFATQPPALYVENYLPLKDRGGRVVAVVEVYKEPKALMETLHRGYLLIWLAATLAALVIYTTLFWIVHRAAKALDRQEKELVENETLVAVGEMSAAVAHGLRNPLAAIRSSAELAFESASAETHKNLNDIVGQVDRLSNWVRDLLVYTRPLDEARQNDDLEQAVREAMKAFTPQIQRSGIEVEWNPPPTRAPKILGHHWMLSQVLHCVISNAIEAMPKGGKLIVSLSPDPDGKHLTLSVRDTGVGMTEAQLAEAFKPFKTTKRAGLGVGLALTKRIMDRLGGTVTLASEAKAGTEVKLRFIIARSTVSEPVAAGAA